MRSLQLSLLIVLAGASTANAGILGNFIRDRVTELVADVQSQVDDVVSDGRSQIGETANGIESEINRALEPIVRVRNIVEDIASFNPAEYLQNRVDNVLSHVETSIDNRIDDIHGRIDEVINGLPTLPEFELPDRGDLIDAVLEHHESLADIADRLEPILSRIFRDDTNSLAFATAPAASVASSLASVSGGSESLQLLAEITAEPSEDAAAQVEVGALAYVPSAPARTTSVLSAGAAGVPLSGGVGAVPEPGSLTLALAVLGAMAAASRRR